MFEPKPKTEIQFIGYSPPLPTDDSTVYVSEKCLEVVSSRHRQNNLSAYRRVDKYHFVDQCTGELRDYRPKEHSEQDTPSHSYHGFNELRRTILANFTGSERELHLVLTAAPEHSADLAELQQTFRRFWKRFSYRYPLIEYLSIAEPHETGRFHFHVLVTAPSQSKLYIQQLWQVGYTKVTRTVSGDRLSAYFCSAKKKERWGKFYRPGQRLFRCSKGIIRPQRKKLKREEVDTIVEQGGFRWVSGKTYTVSCDYGDGNKHFTNVITKEQYQR